MKLDFYTVWVDYSATGEGRHVWLAILRAENKEQAITLFREGFPDLKDDWVYFGLGVAVKKGINDPFDAVNPMILDGFAQMPESCGQKLYLRFDYNCS